MTARGKFVLTVLIFAVLGVGIWKWYPKLTGPGGPLPLGTGSEAGGTRAGQQVGGADNAAPAPATTQAAELTETQTEVPKLTAPGAYQPKDNVVEIELSEYAGYAGLIMA